MPDVPHRGWEGDHTNFCKPLAVKNTLNMLGRLRVFRLFLLSISRRWECSNDQMQKNQRHRLRFWGLRKNELVQKTQCWSLRKNKFGRWGNWLKATFLNSQNIFLNAKTTQRHVRSLRPSDSRSKFLNVHLSRKLIVSTSTSRSCWEEKQHIPHWFHVQILQLYN